MNEIIYGINVVKSILDRDPKRLLYVYLLKGRINFRLKLLIKELKSADIAIQMVSRKYLDDKASGGLHQGIVACVQEKRKYQENDLLSLVTQQVSPFLLVLDCVTDPHNLGACLRSADAAGVHAVILPRNRSAPLNSIAKKVASGAAETIPIIRVTNLSRTLRLLQERNILIVGTTSVSNNYIYQNKLTGPLAIVMGAEGEGMRRITREHCVKLVSIPIVGTVSSLNVSVAAGVCLFEAMRQRRQE